MLLLLRTRGARPFLSLLRPTRHSSFAGLQSPSCRIPSSLGASSTPFLLQSRRSYVQAPSPPPRAPPRADEAKRQSSFPPGGAAQGGKNHEIAETLLIYHAGTGRTTFLAMLKVTTLFVGAFFCLLVAPSYIKADKPTWETASVLACGLVPFLFVAYTTSPFVTHIHIHLPAQSRSSLPTLQRFIASLSPSTDLTITTMSAIGKPRYSRLQAGHLRPARRRFGIVNYVRDGDAAAEERRGWFHLRPVTGFSCAQSSGAPAKGKGKGKAGKKGRVLTETWIWDAIREKIEKRAAAEKGV